MATTLYRAFKSACRNDDLQQVQDLFRLARFSRAQLSQAAAAASRAGALAALRFLTESAGADVRANSELCLRAAAAAGHLHVVKYLLTDVSWSSPSIFSNRGEPIACAAESKNLNILRYMATCSQTLAIQPAQPIDGWLILSRAAAARRMDAVRYLVEELPIGSRLRIDVHAASNFGFATWIKNGQTELIRYLLYEAPNFGQSLPNLSVLTPTLLQLLEEADPQLGSEVRKLAAAWSVLKSGAVSVAEVLRTASPISTKRRRI